MFKQFLKWAIAATSVTAGMLVIHANSAQAYSFTFQQDLTSSGTLSGEFAGIDANENGQLDAAEFTTFTSTFQGSEPGFTAVSWGLTNLAPFSYFIGPANYAFWVTAPANTPLNGRGWRSNTELQSTVVGYAFSQDGPISGRYFAQDSLTFTAAPVPEPASIAGLLMAGASITYIRHRRK
ncbi:PEP-CTERM sorting domain-containing protein [Kovacikia minuta CCNUW1]|uniref:PEP-CTERM sorting domain-containing protein n=1 Tax=Kovacikia minuta TaxID=2931930 RepID=UPI001CCC73C7|nr:PEP-CTERM sorting domain-containing protein [Kovacikia minuta]UBF25668.1 PEP-CTERM sorting domain-containing protein [Kovacikia minuta CCNUW1]